MKLKLVAVITLSLLFLATPVITFAQEPEQMMMEDSQEESMELEESMESEEGDSMEEIGEFNSFERFWPLVAGRTKKDAIYPLKRIKEKVRGLLIFGKPQKADYAVFLGTKRVLEVESLLNMGEIDLAKATMEDAKEQFAKAESILAGQNLDLGEIVHQMNGRLNNLDLMTSWLIDQYSDVAGELEALQDSIVSLSNNI